MYFLDTVGLSVRLETYYIFVSTTLDFKSGDHQKLSLVNIHDISDKNIMQPNTVSG